MRGFADPATRAATHEGVRIDLGGRSVPSTWLCRSIDLAAQAYNSWRGLQTPGTVQKRPKRLGLHLTRGFADPSERVCRSNVWV